MGSVATKTLVCQIWLDLVPGEKPRPGGFTLHLTNEDRLEYDQDYLIEFAHGRCELFPSNTVYTVQATAEVYDKVAQSKNGLRSFQVAPNVQDGFVKEI